MKTSRLHPAQANDKQNGATDRDESIALVTGTKAKEKQAIMCHFSLRCFESELHHMIKRAIELPPFFQFFTCSLPL